MGNEGEKKKGNRTNWCASLATEYPPPSKSETKENTEGTRYNDYYESFAYRSVERA